MNVKNLISANSQVPTSLQRHNAHFPLGQHPSPQHYWAVAPGREDTDPS